MVVHYPLDFAEDFLPAGQHYILTSNVNDFYGFCSLLTLPGSGYLRMGVVTGDPGSGKTTAIQSYLNELNASAHTGLPPAVRVKVRPKSTQKALATDIVSTVKDRIRGRTSYELADEAADAIVRNDVRLIFVDEADRLNEDTFDLLRHIHDKTGCPVAIVGLDPILTVIDRQAKFESRIGLRMEFAALKPHEVLTVILPQLIFPYWEFDPTNERDLEMGERLWQAISPSLRKLRNVLEISSRLAEFRQQRIDEELIKEALKWAAKKEDLLNYSQQKAPEPPKTAEEFSERRKAAKKGKKRK